MLLAVFAGMSVFAQSGNINREKFDPTKNPSEDLKIAVKTATAENKRILLDVGGEWCIWCHRIDEFIETNEDVKSSLTSAFVILKVNYSKENKNLELLKKFSFPQRFGFPVFVVLDGEGKLLHTQNSSYLEDGEGYSAEKVVDFLHQWRREALLPENYK